jgi:hypothetical protein
LASYDRSLSSNQGIIDSVENILWKILQIFQKYSNSFEELNSNINPLLAQNSSGIFIYEKIFTVLSSVSSSILGNILPLGVFKEIELAFK